MELGEKKSRGLFARRIHPMMEVGAEVGGSCIFVFDFTVGSHRGACTEGSAHVGRSISVPVKFKSRSQRPRRASYEVAAGSSTAFEQIIEHIPG